MRKVSDEEVKTTQGYALAFKRAKELLSDAASMPHDERAAMFLFAAVLSQYEYEKTSITSLPERIGPREGFSCGHHLASILPLIGMSAGMIKSDAHMEDLIAGVRPEEMKHHGQ